MAEVIVTAISDKLRQSVKKGCTGFQTNPQCLPKPNQVVSVPKPSRTVHILGRYACCWYIAMIMMFWELSSSWKLPDRNVLWSIVPSNNQSGHQKPRQCLSYIVGYVESALRSGNERWQTNIKQLFDCAFGQRLACHDTDTVANWLKSNSNTSANPPSTVLCYHRPNRMWPSPAHKKNTFLLLFLSLNLLWQAS